MKDIVLALVAFVIGFCVVSVVVAAEPVTARQMIFVFDQIVGGGTRSTYDFDFTKANPVDEVVAPVVGVLRGIFRDQQMVVTAVKVFEPSGRTVRIEIDWVDSKESATRQPNRIVSIRLEVEMGASLTYSTKLVRNPRPVDSIAVNSAVEKLARLHLGVSVSDKKVRVDVQTSTSGEKKLTSLVTLFGGSWDFVKSIDEPRTELPPGLVK